MLAERLALVAREDHERIIHAAHPPHGVEEDAQPAVDQTDGPGVSPPESEQFGLAENVADGTARDIDQRRDILDVELLVRILGILLDEVPFFAGLELVRLDRHVLVAIRLGRVPRSMRAEEIEPEHERISFTTSTFEPVDRGLDRTGNARVLLIHVAAEDGPIAQELLPTGFPELIVRVVFRWQPEAGLIREPDFPGAGIIRRDQRVVPLSPDPDHLVEPASEAHAGLAE